MYISHGHRHAANYPITLDGDAYCIVHVWNITKGGCRANFIHIWTSKIFHPFSNNPRAEIFIMFLYHIVITLYRSLFLTRKTQQYQPFSKHNFVYWKLKFHVVVSQHFADIHRAESEWVSRRRWWGLLWKCSWKKRGCNARKIVRGKKSDGKRAGVRERTFWIFHRTFKSLFHKMRLSTKNNRNNNSKIKILKMFDENLKAHKKMVEVFDLWSSEQRHKTSS